MLSAFPVKAQNHAGLIGGVNIANIKTDTEGIAMSLNNLTRFGVGGGVGINLNENFYLHFEPMYFAKRRQTKPH